MPLLLLVLPLTDAILTKYAPLESELLPNAVVTRYASIHSSTRAVFCLSLLRCYRDVHDLRLCNIRLDANVVAALRANSQLTKLRLENCTFSSQDLSEIMRHLPKLEKLDLSGKCMVSEQPIRVEENRLTVLVFTDLEHEIRIVQLFADLRHCKRVGFYLTKVDAALIEAVNHSAPGLTELSSFGCKLTENELRAVACMKNLTRLSLHDSTGLNDETAEVLASMKPLKLLSMTQADLSAVGIERLAARPGLTLIVGGCKRVSKEEAEVLKRRYPDLLLLR